MITREEKYEIKKKIFDYVKQNGCTLKVAFDRYNINYYTGIFWFTAEEKGLMKAFRKNSNSVLRDTVLTRPELQKASSTLGEILDFPKIITVEVEHNRISNQFSQIVYYFFLRADTADYWSIGYEYKANGISSIHETLYDYSKDINVLLEKFKKTYNTYLASRNKKQTKIVLESPVSPANPTASLPESQSKSFEVESTIKLSDGEYVGIGNKDVVNIKDHGGLMHQLSIKGQLKGLSNVKVVVKDSKGIVYT